MRSPTRAPQRRVQAPQRRGPGRPAAAEAPEGSLAEQAYALLRRDIQHGVLAPDARLRIEELRRRYEIGPTPLREALSRLLAEGFVTSENHRGFRVPPVSLAELRDLTDQRKLIECTALRTAIERADAHYESQVLAAYHRLRRADERVQRNHPGPFEHWEQCHRDFHRALAAGAQSRWLVRFQNTLYDQSDRYRRLYLPDLFVLRSARDDHARILEATLERDAETAVRLLAEHVERVYQIASASAYFTADERP